MAPGTLRIHDDAVCGCRGDDSANRADRLQQDGRADQSSAADSTSRQSSCSGHFPVAVVAHTHCACIGVSDGLGDRSVDHLDRDAEPEKVVSRASTETSIPVAPAPTAVGATPSTTVPRSNPSPSTREERVSTPQRPSPDRAPAPIAGRPQTFVGTLSITSVPSGASVSLNGKPAGVTPLRLFRQRAGSMAVQIAQDGFERWSAAVRVPADRLTVVTARLRPVAP
jgi:PEGA domain